jgi:hypothetical protein
MRGLCARAAAGSLPFLGRFSMPAESNATEEADWRMPGGVSNALRGFRRNRPEPATALRR